MRKRLLPAPTTPIFGRVLCLPLSQQTLPSRRRSQDSPSPPDDIKSPSNLPFNFLEKYQATHTAVMIPANGFREENGQIDRVYAGKVNLWLFPRIREVCEGNKQSLHHLQHARRGRKWDPDGYQVFANFSLRASRGSIILAWVPCSHLCLVFCVHSSLDVVLGGGRVKEKGRPDHC